MSESFAPPTRTHPADESFSVVADRLDELGQRYRALQLLRGACLFVGGAIVAIVITALLASTTGQGKLSELLLIGCCIWLLVSASVWVVVPLMLQPTAVQMARLVEAHVPGLHNGLTNSVLLSQRPEFRESPFLPTIFEEIALRSGALPLDDAVSPMRLRPLAWKVGIVTVMAILVALIASSAIARGLQQMLRPTQFIPLVSSAKLIDVKPGDVTLINGQPLEISIIAEDNRTNPARLIFDDAPAPITLSAATTVGSTAVATSSGSDNSPTTQSYLYREDHVDHSQRYRVEVGGTQSPWYAITVVKQVKLEQLALTVSPPRYTAKVYPPTTITLTPDNLEKTPVAVPIGSRIALNAAIDVPCTGAMLQLGDGTPIPLTGTRAGRTFTGEFTVSHDVPLSVLLTEKSDQIIARLPEETLMVHATTDAPPAIEMKWPTQDTSIAPDAPLTVRANIKDDYGLTTARISMSTTSDGELQSVSEQNFADNPLQKELAFDLPLKPEQRAHGRSIRIRVDATDNRDLGESGGPQTTIGSVYEIRFRDPKVEAQERKDEIDRLRALLTEFLTKQRLLNDQTVALQIDKTAVLATAMPAIHGGQSALHDAMDQTAATFPFAESDLMVQRTLQMLVANPAKEAVDLSASLASESALPQRLKIHGELQSQQRRIISTLESLLALLHSSAEAATQPSARGGELLSQSDAFKKLDDDLKQFMKEQQRILDQTAGLAKKPVDRYDDNDKALLAQLAMAQEKLDAFMQQKLSDFSKLAEQDMSNPALLKDITQAYSEVTMAKDALKQQSVEMAIPAEENGLESAKEITSNIERWLSNTPDRQQWNMEDPLTKNDVPMPELPAQLEDMIGDLLEQQEDLFDQMEDANANWHDSANKGIGWDAGDGPIADMSAKGVTGNQLPNNNEMDGRSGEGRSGKSQGEFVGDTAVGKGGRNTPTRLDPTPFQKGQVNDTSKDPVGGATGGGKLSGEGGEGLEGPVPPAIKQTMQRLAQKQAEIRNTAERLNLKYQLSRYDSFRMGEAGVMMRQVETDLNAGRFQNAMRRRDLTLDTIDTSRLLTGGEIHVQQDTTPAGNAKLQTDIADAMKGQLPAAWADALKQYYEKLGQQ